MTLLLGACLASGLLLVLSPWWWPKRRNAPERRAPASRSNALVRLLEEAGFSDARPRSVIAASSLGALFAGSISWIVFGVPVITLAAATTAASAPVLWLRARRGRLARSRRALWPDVCDHLIASVRAGAGLAEAVASLRTNAPEPLRPAFDRFARDVHASGHFDSSAARLKIALADPVADRIVETLRMARQVGGTELTAVLRALGASVRAEAHLRAEVDARQSWIRGAAGLGVIAPWVILAMLSLRPEGAQAYSSPEGIVVVLTGGAISVLAYRLMIRIGRLPEPRRWFA
jgi:tight adherence protein B